MTLEYLLSRETNLQEVEATPFPPWMHELLKDVMPLCGFSEEDRTVAPQKSNIDIMWLYFERVHLFQTIILGIQDGIHVSFRGCSFNEQGAFCVFFSLVSTSLHVRLHVFFSDRYFPKKLC